MITGTDQFLKCEFCGTEGVDCQPCHFCGKIVCKIEAHYIPTIEHTIYGSTNKILRVCPDCKPIQKLR